VGPPAAERPGDRKARLVASLAADLAAETAALLPLLARLGEADWDAATPAAGWAIRDQVTHLAFFDDAALLSLRDRDAFRAQAAELRLLGDRFPDLVAEQHRHLPGGYCLEWLASSRASLVAAFRTADPTATVPWYGVEFSVPSAITARLMETWAHGQDIADTIGVTRPPTARLRHVASIGVRALAYSFTSRRLDLPAEPVLVELTAPSGETWTWGPHDAQNRVTGDALDFCLVVTQRRNVADTGLRVAGPVAAQWIAIAQAFAGRPTDPRPPAGEPASASEEVS
jgi:uncharacterized protein (TIGR03084 family)